MSDILTVRDRARFVGPRARSTLVARSRLDHLYDGATGSVIRVLAPGGYGKSSLAARWVAGEDRAVAWVDLERIDNDPTALTFTLGRALAGVADLAVETLPIAPPDSRGFLDTVVPAFGALLGECRTPFVLVLDDVHHVDGEPASAVLAALAENVPPESTLVLCGRAHSLDGAVGRLRLHPGVVDVTAGELALDAGEAGQLLAAMGVELEQPALAELVEGFEGWPAGLRLAGLVLRTGEDATSVSLEQVSQASFVTDYVRAEWIGDLELDDAAFLGEVACLGRFTGEMCDAVLGRRGSTERLRQLHRRELVVLPLDRRDEWYRMHSLLRHALQSDLAASDRSRWRAVHLEAAQWWEERGDIDLAFEHAVEIGDLARAERLVADHGGDYFAKGLRSTVRRWLSSLPAERVASSPALVVMSAFDAMHGADGRRAQYWCTRLTRLAERAAADRTDADRTDADRAPAPQVWAEVAVMRAAVEQRPAAELLAIGENAADDLDGTWRAFACFALGGLHILVDDERADDVLAEGVAEAERVGAQMLRANCLAASAVMAELRGARDRAMATATTASKIFRTERAELETTMAMVAAVSAVVEARTGNRDIAADLVAASRMHLRVFESLAPWLNVLARLALVDSVLVLGDRATAHTLLGELDHHLRLEPTGHGAERHVDAQRAAAASLSGAGLPVVSLTPAELKVLRYLPTNLSLGDIATRLFVSRNTVKSHTAAIYRKLGATSRRDAVDTARHAGLVHSGDLELLD